MINLSRIGWQNGTLVSKAKVEIGGTIYEVDPEEYSGTTPLTAENLTQMETNTENAINVVNNKFIGTVLYDNSTGTSGNVTLSDSVANYDYIEIQATRTLYAYSSGKLYNVNGKTITLTSTYTTDEHFYVYSKTMNVSGNTLTAVSSKMIYMNDSMTRYQVDNDNRIIRVVGYKVTD